MWVAPCTDYYCRCWVAKLCAYMLYLTLWDKISQNMAHLEGDSHKVFKSHIIFRPFYNRFYEEININHILLWFSQASYMNEKYFRLYWGSPKVTFKKISQNFAKSPLKFCLISMFSPQLLACMSVWHLCMYAGDNSEVFVERWFSWS